MFRRCKYLILLFVLILSNQIFAQAPDTIWTKTFGGVSDDEGYAVQQTSDGGYIIAGYTNSFGAGNSDVYLIKTDANGNALWEKTYGGASNERGKSVQQTTDGGYVVAGWTYSFGAGDEDVYLIKTDANGDTLWTKTYGGINGEEGNAVCQTSDGGYIVTGWTASFGAGSGDVYLIKTDANGNALWTKTYGAPDNDVGYSVQLTSDGGYIIAGWTYSFSFGSDVYLIKTDANGDTLWTKTYRKPNDGNNEARQVQQTTDGGYIIVGYTNALDPVGWFDAYLIKTDANGDTLWTKTYGKTGTNNDFGFSVQQTTGSGYIIAGESSSDVWLIRTDTNGDTLWTKTIGGVNEDYGMSVQQVSVGEEYIVAGGTESFGAGVWDVYLLRFGDPTAIEEINFSAISELYYITLHWRVEMEEDNLLYVILKKSVKEVDEYSEIARIPGSGSSPSPQSYSYKDEDVEPGMRYYYKLVAVKENGSTKWYGPASAIVAGTKPFLSISPNPFTKKTVIRYSSIVNSKNPHLTLHSLRIYNVSGRLVKRFTIDNSRFTEVVWDGYDKNNHRVTTGIYFARLSAGDFTFIKKIVLVR